ncbi:MAG: sporulation initiation factor Spo0A C-terminal domain-containing protein [Oscillospiraceae bacterium]|nr:sporulation initiation factor Spo0A C-terminal domain-containing protein [Oscillospiraceae bacterium]
MERIISDVLRPLGATRNYMGYRQTVVAIRLTIEDETRLHRITKDIYSVVAEECNCPVLTVERNIRTLILKGWRTNKKYMCEMAGFPLEAPPSASQFIDFVAAYIQRNYLCDTISKD